MNRSLLIYAALLLGSLGWAYQTWTHEDELALAEKVVLLPGSPDELVSVAYRSPELELTLEFREDEAGRYAWGRAEPKGAALEPPSLRRWRRAWSRCPRRPFPSPRSSRWARPATR